MKPLNDEQFAKYSAVEGPNYTTNPLPLSMERHAPGEYQPTLPGMEKMLKGERTSTDVFFKHPNVSERWVDESTGTHHAGEIPGSRWWDLTETFHPDQVRVRTANLRPSQDWMDEHYLHDPPHPNTVKSQGLMPKVERISGKNVIHDGHHRAVREIMSGKKAIDVERWGGW